MKKFGFTLAEVLIALSIIGVIAAMTIPTLSSNVNNTTNAAKLSAVVANYEQIFGNMILKEDRLDLMDTEFGVAIAGNQTANMTTALTKYTKIGTSGTTMTEVGYGSCTYNPNPFESAAMAASTGSAIKNIRGGNASFDFISAITTGSGSIVFFAGDNATRTEADAISAGASCAKKASTVYIDVNGSQAPNKYGRDVFAYVLGADGVLYPYGSLTASFLNTVANNPTWKSTTNTTYGCTSGSYTGLGCTARLAENGYKVDY